MVEMPRRESGGEVGPAAALQPAFLESGRKARTRRYWWWFIPRSTLQTKQGWARQAAADGGEGPVCSLSSNSAGPRPEESEVCCLFLCVILFWFLVPSGAAVRLQPTCAPGRHELRLLDLGRCRTDHSTWRASRAQRGGVWGPQTARQAMGWRRPVCLLPGFPLFSPRMRPHQSSGPVPCRGRRRWSC